MSKKNQTNIILTETMRKNFLYRLNKLGIETEMEPKLGSQKSDDAMILGFVLRILDDEIARRKIE